jgi:hypothetical protein
VGTDPGVDPLTSRPRCVGSLDGPVGDCDNEPRTVLLTMGLIDEDGQAFDAAAVAHDPGSLEPVPVAFVLCPTHKKAVILWARRMWGEYFDADLYPIAALPVLIEKLELDGLPTAVNPDPAWALEITREFAKTAG